MKKRKSFRSRFEDNYTTVTVPADNKKGYVIRYVYYAPWYVWQISDSEFSRKKQLLAVLEVFSVLIFLVSVLLRTGLNSTPLVYVFTALAACTQLMELSGTVDFLTAKPKTTQIRYEDIHRRLTFFPTIRGIMMLLATIAAILTLLSGQVQGEAWAVPGYAVCAALAWQVQSLIRGIPVRVEQNDAMDKVVAMETADEQSSV